MPDVKAFSQASDVRCIKQAPPSARHVRAILTDLLVEVAGIPKHLISDEATLEKELQMESAQLTQLGVAIEDEFDITLDALEILTLNSFGRIVQYIHELIARN